MVEPENCVRLVATSVIFILSGLCHLLIQLLSKEEKKKRKEELIQLRYIVILLLSLHFSSFRSLVRCIVISNWVTVMFISSYMYNFVLFLSSDDFTAYADVCFREFGDRVSHWTTLNEPNVLALLGYDLGFAPPKRCSHPFGNCSCGNSPTEPYIVMHHCLLAHSSAVSLYARKYKVFFFTN